MNRKKVAPKVRTKPTRVSVFRSKVQRRVSSANKAVPEKSAPARESRPVGMPFLLFVLLSIFIAGTGTVYHLHVRFEGVRLGYEASEERKLQTQLMLKRRELRLELAAMKEPGRIEDEAREKLGMETPRFDRIVPVNAKKRVVSVSGGAL